MLSNRPRVVSAAGLATLLLAAYSPGHSQPLSPTEPDTSATLRIRYEWQARLVSRGEFADVTSIHHVTEVVCPLFASHVENISVLQGPTAEQTAASQALEEVATRQVSAISQDDISSMHALQRQMEECQRKGGSEATCGMQVMAAMQGNPQLMQSMGEMATQGTSERDTAARALEAAAGSFQHWLNDDCSGTMTVNDAIQLDDPTIMGIEPPVLTHGSAAIDPNQTLVAIETDLGRGETRYRIISPTAQGFTRDAGNGNAARTERGNALPVAVLELGPKPGPISSGEHTRTIEGGTLRVSWTLVRN